MPENVDRVTTSTRDRDELRAGLQGWLPGRFPPGAEPTITSFEAPEGTGMSSETVLFDVTTADGTTGRYVARVPPPPSAVPVFPTYDLRKQFDVIRLVGEATSVPVPTARWFEADPAAIGAPFFVMDRIDGVVPPDVMPYNIRSWLRDADRADQERLQEASVAVLAGIHDLDRPASDYAFVGLDRPEPTSLRRHVADQWEYYQWSSSAPAGVRQPLIERGFGWLDEHWPKGAEEAPAVLSWGDARIGNMMYRDFTPVGVFDWEMTSVAPREVDLAWMIFLHRFFEDIATQNGLPGMPHFLRRDDVATTYERLTGHTPRDLDFFLTYASLRHAIIMSRIFQRSMHFGEAEPPDDPDDRISHRATMEAMLDGTYWDRL